jgi:hypothetical protein
MALRKATSTDDGDLLCIINSTDGSLITYSILRGQNVVAPSLCTTNGKFINLGVDVDTLYFLVTRQLPTQATCTITVTDAANIAVGSTITITDNAGTSTTMTATNDDPADALEFSVGGSRTNNDVADNIAVGSGGVLGINALAGYSAPNPAANFITVSRNAVGNSNLTVTSSDTTRLAVTDFVAGNIMKLVGSSTASNTAGTDITLVSATGTSIVVAGDITAYDFFMGEQYTFTYTFSQQYMALGDQYASGSRTRVKDGRLQIRNWTVSYNDTSYFQAVVTPIARDASTTTFTGTVVGSGLAGRVNLEDGDYEFAVLSRNEGLVVSLTNNSHLPSNFVNAEWQGY